MPNLKLIDSWSQSQESFTQKVEDQIIEICNFNPSENPSLESLNLFLINFFKRKSKKVRCKITFECAKSLQIDFDDSVKIAAAVELIHNASILHDKISDEFKKNLCRHAGSVWVGSLQRASDNRCFATSFPEDRRCGSCSDDCPASCLGWAGIYSPQ